MKSTTGKLKLDFKSMNFGSSTKASGESNTPSRTNSQQINTAANASKTNSKANDTADDTSKTNSQPDDTDDTSKASTKPKDGKTTKINFNFGDTKDKQGLKFDTTKKSNLSKSTEKAFGTRMNNSKYDTFLNERISSGANSLSKKDKNKQSSSNQPKLTKKKENVFEVRYIPISGVHFDRIFINKENVSDDDQSIGDSFNQPAHISQTFDS